MRIVDLSMPIGPHFRWRPGIADQGRHRGRRPVPDLAAVDHLPRLHPCRREWRISSPHAPTIEATPLDQVVGPCRILDLRDAAPNEAIGPERLAAADPGGPEGEILLLSAGWDRQRDPATPAFWRDAP